MRNEKGQKLGKRKQKRFLAKHFKLDIENPDLMSDKLFKSLKEDYKTLDKS